MGAVPAEIANAVQQLDDVGMPGIDGRIVAAVLAAHPHLVHEAQEWGWGDTEVRDGLFVSLWAYLTGGDPHARVDESERTEQIYASQRAWLSARSNAESP
jgi:anti-sigma factor RsiW